MSWTEEVFRLNQNRNFFEFNPSWSAAEKFPFSSALSGSGNLIAEFKRTTPDKRVICKHSLEKMAIIFQNSKISAASIVVEPVFFQTTIIDLLRFRRLVAKPLLVKGFFSETWQLEQLKTAGADAVLLLKELLPQQKLEQLLFYALRIGLETVLEIHQDNQLQSLQDLSFSALLINNRNLQTLEVDYQTACRTLQKISEKGFLQPVIVASGLKSGNDFLRYKNFSVNAFLVGASILKSSYPQQKLNAFLRKLADDAD